MNFDIILVGESGVGKSTLVERLRTGEYQKKHIPTPLKNKESLIFYTNKGVITFKIMETNINDSFDSFDGVLYFADFTRKDTLDNIRVLTKKPNVLCVNKVDVKEKKISVKDTSAFKGVDAKYHISAKSNYNYEKPFLYLTRIFLGEDTCFVEAPAILAPIAKSEYQKMTVMQLKAELRKQGKPVSGKKADLIKRL